MTDSRGSGPGDDDDGGSCGDHSCDPGETFQSCPADCPMPSTCGNHMCDNGETPQSCPGDCPGVTCGDHICQASENAQSCPQDCTCGNHVCDSGEQTTCPSDCPATLRVQNNSSYYIYHLYIRHCEVPDWGIDQMSGNIIAPTGSIQITQIPPGCYFFRAANAGSTITWTSPQGVNLAPSALYTWTLLN